MWTEIDGSPLIPFEFLVKNSLNRRESCSFQNVVHILTQIRVSTAVTKKMTPLLDSYQENVN